MKPYRIGVDIGGTKIQTGLVSPKYTVRMAAQSFIAQSGKKAVLQCITSAIEKLITPKVRAIGIGITGHVQSKEGVVAHSVHLPNDWQDVPLRNLLKNKFGLPVAIDNDANCIALGEALAGRGKTYNAVMSITIGTGIGAGLVFNKQIFHGGRESVEFGHTIIDKTNSFENLVSGPALCAQYKKKFGIKKTSYEIITSAKNGEKRALSTLRIMSKWLGIGIQNALLSYSPDIIILGGGLAAVPLLVRPAILHAKSLLPYSDLKKIPIVASTLGYNAGVIGAAALHN